MTINRECLTRGPFRVGDEVIRRENPTEMPRTVLYVHSLDDRTFYVIAYKGDIPYVCTANELMYAKPKELYIFNDEEGEYDVYEEPMRGATRYVRQDI